MHAARIGPPDAAPMQSIVAVRERQAPTQLAPEQVEEVSAAIELHELNLQARRDLDLGSWLQLRILLPVASQDGGGLGEPDHDPGLLRQDDRTVEQAVRVERHVHERPNIRMENGTAQRQAVAGRSGWRRDDDAVGIELSGGLAVHRDHDPDQVDLDALVNHGVIQRMKNAIADPRLEQGPTLEREVPGGPAIQGLPLFAQLDLGEEPEPASVDAQHRNMGGRRLLGGPEQGAVAADADDQAGAVKGIDQGARALLRRGAVGPDPITALLEPAARLHHRRTADVDPGMADDADGLSHSALNTTGIRGYPWRPGWATTSGLPPGIQARGQNR